MDPSQMGVRSASSKLAGEIEGIEAANTPLDEEQNRNFRYMMPDIIRKIKRS